MRISDIGARGANHWGMESLEEATMAAVSINCNYCGASIEVPGIGVSIGD